MKEDLIEKSYLPNKFPEIWEITQKMFSEEVKSIQDLNNVFYQGKSNFFKKIEESFSEDGEKFLKEYNNICKLVLDINNIFPDGEIKILKTRQQIK